MTPPVYRDYVINSYVYVYKPAFKDELPTHRVLL